MFSFLKPKVEGFLTYKDGTAIGSGYLQGSRFHFTDGTVMKFIQQDMNFHPWDD